MRFRRVTIAAAIVLLGVVAVSLVQVTRLATVGVAYKAKMACSGVFVSGRDAQSVLADLEVDDLWLLKQVSVEIDRQANTVTAAAGGIRRRAIYREGRGCALESGETTPHAQATGSEPNAATQVMRPADTRLEDAIATVDRTTRDRLQRVLDRAFEERDSQHLRRTRAIVIVRDGRIVAERYAKGIGADTPLLGWSMTKSVMNALVGILVKDGQLSLDSPLSLREWQGPGDARRRITIDDLLRMSSGLAFDEDDGNPRSDVIHMLFGARDMAGYAANKPLDAAPGTRWHYSSGSSNIVARVIRDVLGADRDCSTFARRRLFEPLGMTGALVETDASGTFVGSSFMYATARDWARFGLLYLQDGTWNGEPILPHGWVAYTRSPAPSDPSRRYGAHFWLDLPDEYRTRGVALPNDAFHAVGHEGQFVTIIPSCRTVVVRLGLTRYPDAWAHAPFVRDVLAALGGGGESAAR